MLVAYNENILYFKFKQNTFQGVLCKNSNPSLTTKHNNGANNRGEIDYI